LAKSFAHRPGKVQRPAEANGLPAQSIPAGTSFADIPSAWRCPDCGTEKTTFRPYVDNPERAASRACP
jgi:rubredoxin